MSENLQINENYFEVVTSVDQCEMVWKSSRLNEKMMTKLSSYEMIGLAVGKIEATS